MKFKNYIETESGIKDTSTSPGTAGQVLSSTVTGTDWIDQGEIIAAAATLVTIQCKNRDVITLVKGTPVYQTGTVGATDIIEVAGGSALISDGAQPSIGLLQQDLDVNEIGYVVITGGLLNITTDPIDGLTPVTGQKVFVKSGGGLTLTKPTTELNTIQNMGLIGKVSVGNSGSITVSSIMRTNDVPNLPEGRIWIGDGNTIVSDTVYVDELNGRVGIGTTSPLSAIQIGDGTAASPSTNQILVLSNTATTGGNSDLYLVTGASGTSTIGMGASLAVAQNTAGKIIYSDIVDTFSFNTNFSTKMVINGDGEVGINTTNPNYKLEVNGTLGVNRTDGIIFAGSAAAGFGNKITSDTQNNFIFSTSLPGVPYTISPRITILNNGDVGIGTTSPSSILHLEDETPTLKILSNQFYNNSVIEMGNGAGPTTGLITCNNNPGLSALELKYDNGATGDARIRVGQRYLDFQIDASSTMYINSSKNVGIGTTDPQAKLHVSNGLLRTWIPSLGTSAIFESTASNRNFVTITGANESELWFGDAATQAKGRVRYEMANNNMEFWTNATQKMVIDGSGNVGIGITNPTAPLHVKGSKDGPVAEESRAIIIGDNTKTQAYYNNGIGVFGKTIQSSGMAIHGDAATGGGYGGYFTGRGYFSGNVGIGTAFPNVRLEIGGGSTLARVIPSVDNQGYIGDSQHRWQAIYATNGTIQTSDIREKTEIKPTKLGLDFINDLTPVSYKWIEGERLDASKDERNHQGLIAQEVAKTLEKHGVDKNKFGGLDIQKTDEYNDFHAMSYEQLIAPMIKAIQELKAEIEELKKQINK